MKGGDVTIEGVRFVLYIGEQENGYTILCVSLQHETENGQAVIGILGSRQGCVDKMTGATKERPQLQARNC